MEESGTGGWRSGLRRGRRRFLESREMNRSLRFFKLILHPAIREEKLKMPKKFVGMFGQELSSKALLTVPNGGVWKVGLEKANGQIWLCDGWNKFADYYSIEYGFLLVFKYEGNSRFQVLIFDRTTSEIRYPHGDGMELEDEVQSDSIISIPSSSSYFDRNTDDECLYQPHTSSKVTCANLRSDLTKSYDVETRNKSRRKSEIHGCEIKSKRSKNENCIMMEDIVVVKNDPRQQLPSRTQTVTFNRQEMAICAATEGLKTRNPSFMVILQPRNIEKSYLYIPPSFSTTYLDIEEEIIEIQTGSKDRKWEIYCYGSGRTSKRMGRGWRVFSEENNLRAGDVLVFELVKRSKNRVMNFTVFASAAV